MAKAKITGLLSNKTEYEPFVIYYDPIVIKFQFKWNSFYLGSECKWSRGFWREYICEIFASQSFVNSFLGFNYIWNSISFINDC